jgi:hypothetical protein
VLKETADLSSADALSVEEVRVNVCDTLEDISNEPYTASRLSTSPKSLSRSDDSDLGSYQKKARIQSTTTKDPPNVNVNWGSSALPRKPATSGGIALGRLSKVNGMCLLRCDGAARFVTSV